MQVSTEWVHIWKYIYIYMCVCVCVCVCVRVCVRRENICRNAYICTDMHMDTYIKSCHKQHYKHFYSWMSIHIHIFIGREEDILIEMCISEKFIFLTLDQELYLGTFSAMSQPFESLQRSIPFISELHDPGLIFSSVSSDRL